MLNEFISSDDEQIKNILIRKTERKRRPTFISGKIIDTNSPTDWSLKIRKNASSQTDENDTKKNNWWCCFSA